MPNSKAKKFGVCAVPVARTQYLIACGKDPGGVIPQWAAYARHSRPGAVFWMNGKVCKSGAQHAPPPPARLSTLSAAVEKIGESAAGSPSVLAMFMHGTLVSGVPIGILHSGIGHTFDSDDLEKKDWNPSYLYLGRWPDRNENVHYKDFTSRLRELTNILEVHLIGCRLGGGTDQVNQFWVAWGLVDFASDIGKKVIAYTGKTAVRVDDWRLRIINEAGATLDGAWQTCAKLYRAFLCTNFGRLSGWQVRCYESRSYGWVIEIFDGSGARTWSRDKPKYDPVMTTERIPNRVRWPKERFDPKQGCRENECKDTGGQCGPWLKG